MRDKTAVCRRAAQVALVNDCKVDKAGFRCCHAKDSFRLP